MSRQSTDLSVPETVHTGTAGRRSPAGSRGAIPPAGRQNGAAAPGGGGAEGRLRIALVAPPWIPIPPPGYGGIETVVDHLATGLVRRGHDVTLLAAPGSRSCADVVALLEQAHPTDMGETLFDADHAARAIEAVARAARDRQPFDVVHDHSGFVLFAMADHLPSPVLHTLHGPFEAETSAFYERHADKAWVSGLSRSQLRAGPGNLRCVGVIPNPIDVDAWPCVTSKQDYLLWVGRMNEEKGPHRAIEAARAAGRQLVLAGPVQPGQEPFFDSEVAPHIDDVHVRYVGEVGGEAKQRLFADAAALLMPIRWPEPFGMVMIEAMGCGTPVVTFREGAAPEVVIDGESGFVVEDEGGMAAAIERLDEIDPVRCRRSVRERFGIDVIAERYERAYRQVLAAARSPARSR